MHSIINDHSGDAVVDRIFRQNTSTPNYISFLLGRSGDPTEPFPGDITIGQPLEPYGNITSQPKLTVTQAEGGASGQHWQTLLDKNGIIGPDGQPISVESGVKGAPKDQLTVIFDSGFSLPQVPKYVLRSLHTHIYIIRRKRRMLISYLFNSRFDRSVADAIYDRIPGAQFQNLTNPGAVWTLPCTAEVNITFKFSNISFPIHPLDTNFGELNLVDDSGDPMCIGAFQPITTGASSNYDMILGMAFCECLHGHLLLLLFWCLPCFLGSAERIYPHRLWRFRRWLVLESRLALRPASLRDPARPRTPRFRAITTGRSRQYLRLPPPPRHEHHLRSRRRRRRFILLRKLVEQVQVVHHRRRRRPRSARSRPQPLGMLTAEETRI